MIEALSNLKNNRIKQNAGLTAGAADVADQLKKSITSISKQRTRASSSLSLSLTSVYSEENLLVNIGVHFLQW
jgi:hypothetical protein